VFVVMATIFSAITPMLYLLVEELSRLVGRRSPCPAHSHKRSTDRCSSVRSRFPINSYRRAIEHDVRHADDMNVFSMKMS
jgi:hypothetical protein